MNKHAKIAVITAFFIIFCPISVAQNFTVLDSQQYQATAAQARHKIQQLLSQLQSKHFKDANEKVAFIAEQLADIPYRHSGAMGEGDWQPTANTYQPGATHIQQNPVYRVDSLDCQTMVQVAMGLLHANTLAQFDQTILRIAYGAAGNPDGQIVRYYNRNHFTDGDFNPVNQRHGFLTDVTTQGPLAAHAQFIKAKITRQKWFLEQQKNPGTVQVLQAEQGPAMVERLQTTYAHLDFPHFKSESISIATIPKNAFVSRKDDGSYEPNEALLNQIPTPALVEMIHDPKRWTVNGKTMKELTGSEFTVSHFGLLYKKTFKKGELIYRRVTCDDDDEKTFCVVKPIVCEKQRCTKLMFAHATDIHPRDFSWYRTKTGAYACAPLTAKNKAKNSSCNRVELIPLYNYLTDYQYGRRYFMEWPSFVGVHVEKLND